MKYLNIVFAFLFVLSAGLVKGQDIISAAETAKLMKNDNVVVVSTRTAADYKKVHITGAVHVNHSSLYKEGPVKNMLNSPSEIAKTLGKVGVWKRQPSVIDFEIDHLLDLYHFRTKFMRNN